MVTTLCVNNGTHLIRAPGVRCQDGQSKDHAWPRVAAVVGWSEDVEGILGWEAARSVTEQRHVVVGVVGSRAHVLVAHWLIAANFVQS